MPFSLATESQPKPVGVQGGLKFSRSNNGFEQSPEADKEFADTERAYGGREAHTRAVESGKTKLNYRQWVQVRTPRFKAWFGDWELANLEQSMRRTRGSSQVTKEAELFI